MHRLWPLYLVIFMGFVGYSIEIPIFTTMMLGENPTLVHHSWSLFTRKILLGVLLAMYPSGQFVGSPILGAFSDRLGRKPTLLFSLVCTIICYIFISISLIMDWVGLLFLLLFLAGLFEGNIAIAQGAIVDATDAGKRNQYFGYIYVCSSAAFIAGPLLGSFFSNSKIVPWFGPATTFWVVTLMMVVSLVCVSLLFRETHRPVAKEKRSYFSAFTNLYEVFVDRKLRYYYAVNFIIYLSIFGFLRVYAIYAVELYKVDLVELSILVAYVAIPFILMNLLVVPRIQHKAKPKTITMIASFLMGLFMIIVIAPDSFNALWITLFLATAALAITMTFSVSMISFMADDSHQGSVMGNNQSIISGAQGISALLGGTLAAIAIRLPFIAFGIFAILATIMLVRKR